MEMGWKPCQDQFLHPIMIHCREKIRKIQVQAALVICCIFICDFASMQLKNGLFHGTYPLIYGIPMSFYVQIHYIRADFWSHHLSHIMKSACGLMGQTKYFLKGCISKFLVRSNTPCVWPKKAFTIKFKKIIQKWKKIYSIVKIIINNRSIKH